MVWKNNKVQITEEESGLVFDYNKVVGLLNQNLKVVDNQRIGLELIVDDPQATKTESEFLLPQAEEVLSFQEIF